jgi:transcription elongation factor Elf1
MMCKNPHCNGTAFVGVVEMDNNVLIGVKCKNCGARYAIRELAISNKLKREGWNSVRWMLGKL